MKYETIGGQVTRGETFAKLLMHLREAQECCAVLGHLEGLHSAPLIQQGWYAVSEMLKRTQFQVTKFAKEARQ